MHAPFNLIKNISPRRPTRGTTNLALQFPSCPLDATSTLRDGAHSIIINNKERCLQITKGAFASPLRAAATRREAVTAALVLLPSAIIIQFGIGIPLRRMHCTMPSRYASMQP